jgi:hypothetical protein
MDAHAMVAKARRAALRFPARSVPGFSLDVDARAGSGQVNFDDPINETGGPTRPARDNDSLVANWQAEWC